MNEERSAALSARLARLEALARRLRLVAYSSFAVALLFVGAWTLPQDRKPAAPAKPVAPPPHVLHKICDGGQFKYPVLVRWDTQTGEAASQQLRPGRSWHQVRGYGERVENLRMESSVGAEGDGYIRKFHANGIKALQALVQDNQYEGRYVEWSDTGAVMVEGLYLAGQKHGRWVVRNKTTPSVIASEGTYEKGRKVGKWIQRNSNGMIAMDGSYDQNGMQTGEWRTYHSNGQLYSKGSFKDGLRDGLWEFWDSKGQPDPDDGTGTYVNGQLVK